MSDVDIAPGDLDRLEQLAELARGSDAGLVSDDTCVEDALKGAELLVGAIRDETRVLSVLAKFIRDNAGAVAIEGAPDEGQAGREFCEHAADQIAAVAASVRDAVLAIPGGALVSDPGLVDALYWKVALNERQDLDAYFLLFEHRADTDPLPENDPVAAYMNETAARHIARQRAEDLPAGMRISVYEVESGELLPEPIHRLPGRGGERGLVARTDPA